MFNHRPIVKIILYDACARAHYIFPYECQLIYDITMLIFYCDVLRDVYNCCRQFRITKRVILWHWNSRFIFVICAGYFSVDVTDGNTTVCLWFIPWSLAIGLMLLSYYLRQNVTCDLLYSVRTAIERRWRGSFKYPKACSFHKYLMTNIMLIC